MAVVKELSSPILQIIHGSRDLPSVYVDNYSTDIKDKDGYFGEKASNGTFRRLLENVRERLRATGDDPIEEPTEELSKKRLDKYLLEGDSREAGIILSVAEQFAQNLARVANLLLQVRAWSEVERIVVGGGFRGSRLGEMVIGRAEILVKAKHEHVDILPIRHDPDEAGLIGCAHLVPKWLFEGVDYMVAVDIGGSNFRCGLVDLNIAKASDLSEASVAKLKLWRHAEEKPRREEATQNLGEMIDDLLGYADKKGWKVAPIIGVGCPGTVLEDGRLEGGTLNLPGDWGKGSFNLVTTIREMIPAIRGHDTMVALHNDAVVQGLGELPYMQDVAKWGVLTIGTGLGNASFRNKGP